MACTPLRRTFFFLVDGARVDVFADLLRRGDLPNVSRYLVEPGAFRSAVTVFPSVTGVAYIPYLTGVFPGRANIPGYRWFDRREYARTRLSRFRFRNYHGLGSYLMDRDMHKDVVTLFELLRPSSNIFSGISRGTGLRRNAAYFRRIPAVYKFFRTGDWDHIDQHGADFLLRAARRRGERFTFHTTYSIDEYSHHHGPFSPRVREALCEFDRVLGRLLGMLRITGQLDESLLVLGADHGHTEVSAHFDLEGFFERRGLRTLYFPKQFQRWADCDCAVMVAGNGMGHVYLRGHRGDGGIQSWLHTPTGDELLARDPHLIDDLLAQDAVAHVIWRPDGRVVRVASRRGRADIELLGDELRYQVLGGGGDPFGYPPLPERMTRAEVLQRTAETDFPDAPLQVAQVFDSPRAGDFIVSASPGYDLRLRHERVEHRSCHGSLHREHMRVPFAINRPIGDRLPRTVDVFNTILRHMGHPVPMGVDGRDLVA